MAVYAPDSGNDMELHEACLSSVLRVFREGRRVSQSGALGEVLFGAWEEESS